jgi:hypothetical protein
MGSQQPFRHRTGRPVTRGGTPRVHRSYDGLASTPVREADILSPDAVAADEN